MTRKYTHTEKYLKKNTGVWDLEHCKTFWKYFYKEVQNKMTVDVLSLMDIYRRLDKYKEEIVNIDRNRIETTERMGFVAKDLAVEYLEYASLEGSMKAYIEMLELTLKQFNINRFDIKRGLGKSLRE